MTPPTTFAGIDVSKNGLDVGLAPGPKSWSTTNDASGISELVQRLTELEPALVVLEATGGYEAAVVAALLAAKLPVAVVNPR